MSILEPTGYQELAARITHLAWPLLTASDGIIKIKFYDVDMRGFRPEFVSVITAKKN